MIDHHTALIYTMVVMAAADRDMTDAELKTIGEMVQFLPVFKDYDLSRLTQAAEDVAGLLEGEDGLDELLDIVEEALPEKLHETAYALACDVAAADLKISQEELRLLEMMRHRLAVGRLPAAAIERATRARHMVV